MAKTPPKDYFASVMFPGTKKLSIVSKRVGTKERLHAIATVTNEGVADRIVEALNHHQGAVEKLDAPAQRLLDQTKEELAKQRKLHSQYYSEAASLRSEATSLRRENRELRDDIDRLKRGADALKSQLQNAICERDAAQAEARKNAVVARQVSAENTAALMK